MNMSIRQLAATLVAVLCITVAPASHGQTVANGPYYATPSWDQTMPASTRFVVLANFASEAVLDRETGLVWMRSSPQISYSRLQAEQACFLSTTGGRRGWRLPSEAELFSLFDPAVTTAPFLPAGHPFTGLGASATIWSSTPVATIQPPVYWAVGWSLNGPIGLDGTNNLFPGQILCVRGMA